MNSISAMETFVLVVNQGSFSAAARQLGVAPSSVSRQINDLESELGVSLFHRSTRTLSLTEAGHIYKERAARILDEVEETKLALSELNSPSGVLRVTMPTGIGRELIISALPAFLRMYPGIKASISMTDSIEDIIETGIDVAIRVGQLQDSSIKARKVGTTRRIVCASTNYLKAASPIKIPQDLTEHNCLTFRQHPGANTWSFESGGNEEDIQVSGNFFASNAEAIMSATLAGLGVALLPEWSVRSELASKRLEQVLENYAVRPADSTIWAVHAHPHHVPPKIRAFIDFLVDIFDDTSDLNIGAS